MNHIEACLDYILEHEWDDFHDGENASEDHVYFQAYAANYGLDKARAMLKEHVDDLAS